jgi:hypothetical protein
MTITIDEFRSVYTSELAKHGLKPRESTIVNEYKSYNAILRLTGCESDIEVIRNPSGRVEVLFSPTYPNP